MKCDDNRWVENYHSEWAHSDPEMWHVFFHMCIWNFSHMCFDSLDTCIWTRVPIEDKKLMRDHPKLGIEYRWKEGREIAEQED